jgi:hypothetical protein
VVRLPLWAIFTIAFGSPLLAFAGVLLTQMVSRRAADELETRSKREETMRNLRWSSELAVSRDDRMADLGVAQLAALLASDLLDDAEKLFVEAALDVVYQDPEAELDALGQDAEVIQLPGTDAAGPSGHVDDAVPSDLEGDRDGGSHDE